MASGHHYIRDGMGAEMLYDLRNDPFERVNLMGSPSGDQAVGAFRKMLLEVLTENPGSIEVEKAYLAALQARAQSPRSREFPAASRRRPLNRHRSVKGSRRTTRRRIRAGHGALLPELDWTANERSRSARSGGSKPRTVSSSARAASVFRRLR